MATLIPSTTSWLPTTIPSSQSMPLCLPRGGRYLLKNAQESKNIINNLNINALSPFTIAVSHGNYTIANMLLDHGARFMITQEDLDKMEILYAVSKSLMEVGRSMSPRPTIMVVQTWRVFSSLFSTCVIRSVPSLLNWYEILSQSYFIDQTIHQGGS